MNQQSKFREHKHNTGLDYGTAKSQCLFFQTREWDKKLRCWKPLVETIVDAMENLRNYPQISTGLHHYERQIIVVDIDNERWPEFEQCWVDKFPQFSYRLENPDTHHVQYGWLLAEPLSNKDGLFKAIKRSLPKTINLLIKKKFETEGKLADEAYTGWRCKNPLYEKFTNVVLNLDKTTTVEELLGCIDVEKIPETVPTGKLTDAIRKVAKDNKISNALTSRNDYMVTVFGEEVWNIFKNKGKDVKFEYIRKVGLKFAKDAGYITNKGTEEESIVERQIKDIYNWRYANYCPKSSYNNVQRRMSCLNNKYKFFKRIVQFIKELNSPNSNNCSSPLLLLYTGVKKLKRTDRMEFVSDKVWSRIKNLDKQSLRNDVEEYKERLELSRAKTTIGEELKLFDLFFETKEELQYETIIKDSPAFSAQIKAAYEQLLQEKIGECKLIEDDMIKETKIDMLGYEMLDLSVDEETAKKQEEVSKEIIKYI